MKVRLRREDIRYRPSGWKHDSRYTNMKEPRVANLRHTLWRPIPHGSLQLPLSAVARSAGPVTLRNAVDDLHGLVALVFLEQSVREQSFH